MSGIFISHSSLDRSDSEETAARLRQQGYQSLFLDFDPADGIPAGRNWEREIYTRLRGCGAVILLCSEHSMASDWCFAEVTHARALGKQLFPVIISPCELRPILRDTQVIDLTIDRETGFQRLWQGMRSAGLDPADTFDWDINRPPYPGLTPFMEKDAAVYFGREEDLHRCLDTLEQMSRYGGDRLLLMAGTSGSGKSSLVRAGVIPKLVRRPEWLVLEPLRPRREPVEALARVVELAFAVADHPADPQRPSEQIKGTAGDDQELIRAVNGLQRAAGHEDKPVLLVIDQLEELVTTSDEGAARRFVALIKAAVTADAGQLFCLATLRSDYMATLQSHPVWQQTRFRELTLGPMTPRHFAEIISKPAAVAGIELEPGLVETLVQDTGTADALSLLAFTLNRLWREFGGDGRITLAEYTDRIGGLEGSIRQEAEAVLSSLAPDQAQLAELRLAFRNLVRIDDAGNYTRRTLHWRDLPSSIRPLMEAFVKARLLVSGQDESVTGGVGEQTQTATLEVAHEALFRSWDKLKRWLDEDRAFLLWRQQIAPDAEAWRARPKDQGLLLRGGPLAEAERWLNERDSELGEDLQGFILASRKLAWRNRLIRRLLVAGIALGLALVTWQAVELSDQRREILAQLVNSYWNIGIAARDAESNAVKAAHQFTRVADLTSGIERENALISTGLLTGGVELRGIIGLVERPDDLHTRHDDSLALLRIKNQAQLWDLSRGEMLTGTSHPGQITAAAIASGRRAVSMARDGSLKLWGPSLPELELVHEGARGMEVNETGDRLLSWIGDGSIRLWTTAEGREISRTDQPRRIAGARFLGVSGKVLLWGEDDSLQIWHPLGTEPVSEWNSGCRIQGVAISPDNTNLVTWCENRVTLHDARAGRVITSWSSPEPVDAAQFVPAIPGIVSWNEAQGRVRIWSAQNGRPRFEEPFQHRGSISRVLFTPDGKQLITSGSGGQINLWDLEFGELAARGVHGPGETLVTALLSGDGTRTLTWSRESGARLWDTATMNPLSLPLLHTLQTGGAHFFDNDLGILTWDQGADLRIWRRNPSLESTAPASPPDKPASAAGDSTRVADEIASLNLDVIDRIRKAGLLNYTILSRNDRMLLLGSGTVARVLLLDAESYPLSTPLTLGERIRGGLFDADSARLLLWGESSVRLWDGVSGRPLGGLMRSDVLFPAGALTAGGLLTWEPQRARQWRWPALNAGEAHAERRLSLVSGTRLDPQNGVETLDRSGWCEMTHEIQPDPQPIGCGASESTHGNQ